MDHVADEEAEKKTQEYVADGRKKLFGLIPIPLLECENGKCYIFRRKKDEAR
ncbi:MAG: hypothetical protein HYS81_01515 [Candidatus Aenigmatarchaeota archaeon]|nr:MAG: hypothetical protein HYS81_01515 [Candidatus Aenigmarchaeota archaeon]